MNKSLLRLAAVAALVVSPGVFAQAYMGIAAGRAKINDDCAGTTTCDLSDVGMKVFGGYRLNPVWAAELNYFDFGKAEATLDTGAGIVSATIKAKAVGVGFVGSGAVTPNWTGFMRFGVARVKADVSASLGNLSLTDSDTSTQAYIGVGISYLLNKNWSLDGGVDFMRARWQDEETDVNLISFGLSYSF
jgi:OmpA-OmpF porin, OOP family